MKDVLDWALKQIGGAPAVPVPFLLAVIILGLLVFPTVRRAWRTPEKPSEAVPFVRLDAGSVFTVLVNIELGVAELKRQVAHLQEAVATLEDRLIVIEKSVRRRQNPGGKRHPKGGPVT